METSKWVWAAALLAIASAESPCDGLRDFAEAARNASSSSNVIGTSQEVEFSGGDVITGDLFVMEDAKVSFLPGSTNASAPIVVHGNIYLFDRAVLSVGSNTQVTISQTAPNQKNIYAFDTAAVEFDGAVVDHGSSLDLPQTWHLCHSSRASTTQVDYSQRTKGSIAAFVWDTASLVVDQLTGTLLDVTLANSASFTATSNHQLVRSNTYLVVDEAITSPITGWRFASAGSVSTQLTSATGRLNASLEISNTLTYFGLVLNSGANVVLNQSQAILVPSWSSFSSFNTPASGLQPCSALESTKGSICLKYEERLFNLGAGPALSSVRFLNSEVEFWKVNFEGAGSPTTHKLINSKISASNCRSQAICTYEGVTINGDEWGVHMVEDQAIATHSKGAIVTFTFVRNHARAVFEDTAFTYNTGVRFKDLRLQVDDNSVVKLINTKFPTFESTQNATDQTLRAVVDSSSLLLRASFAPFPVQTVTDENCGPIMAPAVEMEVLPISAARSYSLEVLDDIQAPVAARSVSSPPAFFFGEAAWGGNATLFEPTHSGVYILQITTTSGDESAVARQLVNVTGCKAVGCPYSKITALFDVCDPALFTGPAGTCISDECRAAASDLTQAWRTFTPTGKLTCVNNYPKTVGSRVPYELNVSEAAIRLSQRDLCAPLVSDAPAISPFFALVLLSAVLL